MRSRTTGRTIDQITRTVIETGFFLIAGMFIAATALRLFPEYSAYTSTSERIAPICPALEVAFSVASSPPLIEEARTLVRESSISPVVKREITDALDLSVTTPPRKKTQPAYKNTVEPIISYCPVIYSKPHPSS